MHSHILSVHAHEDVLIVAGLWELRDPIAEQNHGRTRRHLPGLGLWLGVEFGLGLGLGLRNQDTSVPPRVMAHECLGHSQGYGIRIHDPNPNPTKSITLTLTHQSPSLTLTPTPSESVAEVYP